MLPLLAFRRRPRRTGLKSTVRRHADAAKCWLLVLCVFLTVAAANAQELRPHRQTLSVYLDLRAAAPGASPQTTPTWVEALEFIPAARGAASPESVAGTTVPTLPLQRPVFRIRLHRPPGSASEYLQARVFFQDSASGERPRLTLWNELGEALMAPVTVGQGLGLPSSETLTLPMHGVDYLEIETSGDGSQVRSLFLSWLEAAEVLQPSDFRSKQTVRQPFRIVPPARRRKTDSLLYGVVTANLQAGPPVVLKPAENPTAEFRFELERPPLLALVTYEVLGAPVDAPPNVTVNGRDQGASTLQLPDLADPGFQGESREAESQMGFRYTGWLPAQKIIPGRDLTAGLNNLRLGLSNGTDAVAVRAVAIQLKYDWEKLDYVLAPAASPTHENP